MSLDFFDEFSRNLEKDPDRNAFLTITAAARRSMTYRQVDSEIRKISCYLKETGVQPGDILGILMENDPRWVIAFLAAQSAGAIIVPLDFLHRPETQAYLIDHAECSYLISSEKMLPLLDQIQNRLSSPLPVLVNGNSSGKYAEWDTVLQEVGEKVVPLPLAPRSLDDPLIVMYTSGTTGNPKGVILSARSLYKNVVEGLKIVSITRGDCFLAVLPLYHILSLQISCIVPLYCGSRVILLEVLDAQKILKTIREEGVSVFVCVPQFFYVLYRRIFAEIEKQNWFKRFIFARLLKIARFSWKHLGINLGKRIFPMIHSRFGDEFRLFGVGGARFDPEIAEGLGTLGFEIFQAYGMTETGALATITSPGPGGAISVGQPLPHVEIRIDSPDDDGIGEILIRGENIMHGYLKNPEATAETLDQEGWLHSGDQGYIAEDGNLFVTGRMKDVIVLSSGKNIYPDEIEHFYQNKCPFIKEMCVLGIADTSAAAEQEKLHAVIVPDFDYLKKQQVVNAYEMIRYLLETHSQQLPSHKRVHSLEIWQEPLPRTTTKKIKRFEVQRRVEEGTSVETAPEESAWEPQDPVEQFVLDQIRQIKSGAAVRPDMNLELDLGFDSLERVEFIANLQDSLGIEIGDTEATELFTVREVVDLARQRESSGSIEAPAAAKSWKEILNADLQEEDRISVTERLRRRPFVEFLFILVSKLDFLLARIFFRLKGEGLENLPRDYPFMVCPNHLSFLDGFLVVALLPARVIRRFFSLGYTDYFSSGIVGWLGRLIKTVPVDPDRNLRQALRLAAEGLKNDLVLCVFPEGERSIDGTLKAFRKGPAILATQLRVPVVPAGVIGSYEAWRRGSSEIKFRPVKIRFGKPIQPFEGETVEEFNIRLRNAVQELL
jgi:long-chain acyl-CoA synthetase